MRLKFKFLEKYAIKLPEWVIPVVALFGGAIFLFTRIAHETIYEQEIDADNNILKFLSTNVVNPHLTPFMKRVTYMGSATFLQVGYGVLVIIFLLNKNYKRCIEVAVVGSSGLLVNLAMKYSFHRLRPPDPLIDPLKTFSFPSGHATSAFIFYGLLVYLVWKTTIGYHYKITAGILLISLSLLIGFSRVYLRVHYPSDVSAGLLIGFAWLLLLITLMERIKREAKQEAVKETIQEQGQLLSSEVAESLKETK